MSDVRLMLCWAAIVIWLGSASSSQVVEHDLTFLISTSLIIQCHCRNSVFRASISSNVGNKFVYWTHLLLLYFGRELPSVVGDASIRALFIRLFAIHHRRTSVALPTCLHLFELLWSLCESSSLWLLVLCPCHLTFLIPGASHLVGLHCFSLLDKRRARNVSLVGSDLRSVNAILFLLDYHTIFQIAHRFAVAYRSNLLSLGELDPRLGTLLLVLHVRSNYLLLETDRQVF